MTWPGRRKKCYALELPVGKRPVGNFIKFGYWDSLRKGLMSGEKLQFDLRKMEATYMEENERELELTKHFSLATINPLALLKLRQEGHCIFDLVPAWFDLDFPGHYLRRIKSVSISIPLCCRPLYDHRLQAYFNQQCSTEKSGQHRNGGGPDRGIRYSNKHRTKRRRHVRAELQG